MASDLTGTSRWLSAEGSGLRVVDGRHGARVDTGAPGGPMDLVLASSEAQHVCWEMWWGQRYGGSHTFDLQPLEGGPLVVPTREITTFGRSAATMPLVRFTDGPLPVGVSPALVLLSLGCLSGGAWALVMARAAGRGPVAEDDRPWRDHRRDGPAPLWIRGQAPR